MKKFGRRLKITGCLAAVVFVLASSPVNARAQNQLKLNDAPRAVDSVTTPSDNILMGTLLVVRLAEYGDRQKDGLSLLIAARIADELGLRQHDVKVRPQVTSDKGSQSLSRQALLARAQTYAVGRPDLLNLIADAQASSTRGAQRGPWADKVTASIVQPSEFLVTFAKGVKATFGIRGDGDSDLELEIVDATGKKMCAPPQAGDVKSCNWVPIETAEYQIVVRNKGAAANRFTYYHN